MLAGHQKVAPGFFVFVTLEYKPMAVVPIDVDERRLGVRRRNFEGLRP
jgi:hypothetical protein